MLRPCCQRAATSWEQPEYRRLGTACYAWRGGGGGGQDYVQGTHSGTGCVMGIDLQKVLISTDKLRPHEDAIVDLARRRQHDYEGAFDDSYGPPLRYYVLFTHEPSLLGIRLPKSTIFYNRYYWFLAFKTAHTAKHGYDAGLEQQAFRILEYAHEHENYEIDLSIVDAIDRCFDNE